jgi:protein-S-isoprenylcysteine O-methyltransferase Ste14
MANETPSTPSTPKFFFTPGVIKRFAQIAAMVFVQAVLLFGSAGRWNWIAGWFYMGLYLVFLVVNSVLLASQGTALIEERGKMLPQKTWDRVFSVVYGVSGLATLIVAGLDNRLAWSPPLGWRIQILALALMAAGMGLFSWSMATNAYFSAIVRVQEERGHRVVSSGPYRFVRHPGYCGIILFSLVTPVLFESLWAFIPAIILSGSIVARTWLEDRTLQAELEGYKDYTHRVRFRLIPGIW